MNIVRELRQRAGLQQKEVALAVGVTSATVSDWERGKKDPSGERLRKLSDLFSVDAGTVLGYKPLGMDEYRAPHVIPMNGRVPLIGEIACGTPITAQQNIEEMISLPDGVRADFALRCRGTSMVPTFNEGDIVLIRQEPDVADGKIAAVLIDNEATLKRIHHLHDGVMLIPDNTADFSPVMLSGDDAASIRILGVAVGYVRMI